MLINLRSEMCARCVLTVQLLITAAVYAMVAGDARAQDAEQLPEIVVEGATLAKPAPKAAKPAPVAAEDDTAPATVKKKAQSAATAGPATPPTETSGDSATASTGGIPIDEIGSSVSVVTGEQLKAQQVRNGADALRSLPGVAVSRNSSIGGKTQVRIRGAEANHTLVMIDGIEANDSAEGEFDFADLSAEDIERIEVIRGGYSGIYGSGAVGGVINIITRSGKGPLRFSARAEAGSFETREASIRASAGNENVWASIFVNKFDTEGYDIAPNGSERDGAERVTFNLRGGFRVMDGLVADYTLRHVNRFGERDTQDFVTGIQIDDADTFEDTSWLGAFGLTWSTLDNRLTHQVRAKWNETERTDHDVDPFFPFETQNLGERIDFSYLGTYRFNTGPDVKNTVSGLVEHEQEFFTPNSDFADGIRRERERFAFAGEYRTEILNQLFVTGALRHDNNDTFENFTTWRTDASWKVPGTGIRPHASVGTSVKFPTMFEQFGFIPAFFLPNPDLKSEESFGWDAGVEFAFLNRKVLLDVTYFEANLENEIRGVGFPTTPINLVGESERRGVEVAGSVVVTAGLTVGASYTYLDASDPDGAEEIRRAPHAGRLDINYAFAGGLGNFNIAAIYNGDMKDTSFPGFIPTTVTLDEYWLINVAASYKVAPGVELYGRVENALDENYQEVFGFETAGVAAYAGIRLTYDEPASVAWSKGQ